MHIYIHIKDWPFFIIIYKSNSNSNTALCNKSGHSTCITYSIAIQTSDELKHTSKHIYIYIYIKISKHELREHIPTPAYYNRLRAYVEWLWYMYYSIV